jgi:hypothetical protein
MPLRQPDPEEQGEIARSYGVIQDAIDLNNLSTNPTTTVFLSLIVTWARQGKMPYAEFCKQMKDFCEFMGKRWDDIPD